MTRRQVQDTGELTNHAVEEHQMKKWHWVRGILGLTLGALALWTVQ